MPAAGVFEGAALAVGPIVGVALGGGMNVGAIVGPCDGVGVIGDEAIAVGEGCVDASVTEDGTEPVDPPPQAHMTNAIAMQNKTRSSD